MLSIGQLHYTPIRISRSVRYKIKNAHLPPQFFPNHIITAFKRVRTDRRLDFHHHPVFVGHSWVRLFLVLYLHVNSRSSSEVTPTFSNLTLFHVTITYNSTGKYRTTQNPRENNRLNFSKRLQLRIRCHILSDWIPKVLSTICSITETQTA